MNLNLYDKPRGFGRKRPRRKRILIVTEGLVTEPTYFERLKIYLELNRQQLEVVVEAGPDHCGNTPTRVVETAVKLRQQAEAKQSTLDDNGDLEAREAFDDVWVVFDTERDGKNIDLKPAAEFAHQSGLNTAISRPSFESWFLIHFGVNPSMSTCEEVCKEISKITQKKYGQPYRKKSDKNVDLIRLINSILPVTQGAIVRSKQIAKTAFFDHNLVPAMTGTKVHELVEQLWESSPKAVKLQSSSLSESSSELNQLLDSCRLCRAENLKYLTEYRSLVEMWDIAIVDLVKKGNDFENAIEILIGTISTFSTDTPDIEFQKPSLGLAALEYLERQKNA